jgi:hypothetical protein
MAQIASAVAPGIPYHIIQRGNREIRDVYDFMLFFESF